jgi:hypothetical protein
MKKILYITVCSIPVIGIMLYLLKFGKCPTSWNLNFLSDEPTSWGVFGDYANWIIGVANLILLFKLTQIANLLLKQSVSHQIRSEIIKNFIENIQIDQIKILSTSEDKNSLGKEICINLMLRLRLARDEFGTLVSVENSKEINAKIDVCIEAVNSYILATECFFGNTDNHKKVKFTDQVQSSYGSMLEHLSELKILLYQEVKSF